MMGTNYYIRKNLDEKAKSELIEAIKNNYYTDIYLSLKKIHIGKLSKGWKFLWDSNYFQYFKPDVESLHKFLKSGTIFDEYGYLYTYEEFVEAIAEHDSQPGLLDAYTHDILYGGNTIIDKRYYSWFEKSFNIKLDSYGEFYLKDNSFPIKEYRFTVNVDFS